MIMLTAWDWVSKLDKTRRFLALSVCLPLGLYEGVIDRVMGCLGPFVSFWVTHRFKAWS